MYDFSVLSKWNNNWRAHIDTDRVGYPANRKIFINVCRNIVKGSGAEGCHHESGICMIRGSTRYDFSNFVSGLVKLVEGNSFSLMTCEVTTLRVIDRSVSGSLVQLHN